MMPEQQQDDKGLASRRAFLRRVALGAGVAFGAPAILSAVCPSDLSAQVSGGGRPLEADESRDRIIGQGEGRGRGQGRGQGQGQGRGRGRGRPF